MFKKVSDFVQEALQRKSAKQSATQSLFWGCINAVLLATLIYDLRYGGFSTGSLLIWWSLLVLVLVCILNILSHAKSYLFPMFGLDALEVNQKQRKLLGISNNDLGFKDPLTESRSAAPTSSQSPKLSELIESTIRIQPTQPLGISSIPNQSKANLSWYENSPLHASFASSNSSFFADSTRSPDSLNASGSITSDSWAFHRNQSSLMDSSFNMLFSPKKDVFSSSLLERSGGGRNFSPSLQSSPNLSSSSAFHLSPLSNQNGSITSREQLDDYLKDFQEKERKKQILSDNESSSKGSKSFWAYNSSSNTNGDFISSLKQLIYQPSINDSGSETPASKSENSTSTDLNSSSASKIWLRRNITQKDLFQFEENLRLWLSATILRPLVSLISACNDELAGVAPELSVGGVGVDKLKKAAQNISGLKNLNYLIPFVDWTVHQDYLVERLKTLSEGGAISAFKWNSGGKFNGRPWREEYPTDSYILLSLFSVYMDMHLPPDPTQPDGRVFSNVHVLKTPEKPSLPTSQPFIYLAQMNPPHVKVYLPPDQECDVGVGPKNLFHSFILFWVHVARERHSQIAGVNLSLSGINLAWVVGEKSDVPGCS